jgi:uncharacterized protein YbbC (DUF1343 family)
MSLKSRRKVVLGLEKLCESQSDLIKGSRVGLVCNQASVDHGLNHSADVLRGAEGVNLTALFGPQHGIRGDLQDNMIETPHTIDTETGLPVYSLYSETREPTEEMLRDVDVLVCDLQDIGCRIYTFIYTIANCMRVARRLGKRVVVCDRPNPIGGVAVEGNVLENGFESFVGQYPLPTRHGMTAGELARMFNEHWGIGCELEVVPLEGWSRELWFDETDAPWVLPSPNIPTLDSATVFPGTVHVEGTQMSEGRGTTRPFEFVGAPYVEAGELARSLEALSLPGVKFRPTNFQPTFQKHGGVTCGGVQIHVLDREVFKPVLTGLAIIKSCFDNYGDDFGWKEPPYEYVFDKNPFDVISGTDRRRKDFERGASLQEIEASWTPGLESFYAEREKFLLYR